MSIGDGMNKSVKRKVVISSFICVFILLAGIFSYFLFEKIHGFSNYLSIELIGNNIELEIGSKYEELGAKAIYKGNDISDKVLIENNIRDDKIGSYNVEYTIKYRNLIKKVIRKINVVDKTPPTITLNGNNVIYFYLGEEFKDPGVVVTDNYDSDLNSKIEITNNIDINKQGTYEVIYKVKDSSGNENSISRQVVYRKKIVVTSEPKIAVLNYHFFYDSTKGEKCSQSICLDVKKFKEQLNYLKENNFKTLTIEEFRAWMYGEIELPKKSVLITIDDGAMGTGKDNGNKLIPILEEYQMHATLFLISSWWNSYNYASDYLDIQSHTYDMHIDGVCSNQPRGAKMLCSSYDEVVKDLKASINVLQSNTAFCFPFYYYNNTAMQAVKDVGFKLAFIGGNKKASRNSDKYKIPRYPIYNTTTMSQFKNMVN